MSKEDIVYYEKDGTPTDKIYQKIVWDNNELKGIFYNYDIKGNLTMKGEVVRETLNSTPRLEGKKCKILSKW